MSTVYATVGRYIFWHHGEKVWGVNQYNMGCDDRAADKATMSDSDLKRIAVTVDGGIVILTMIGIELMIVTEVGDRNFL